MVAHIDLESAFATGDFPRTFRKSVSLRLTIATEY